ncbi:unnamed protein product [Sphenostylis stenocarpa]|uniref:Uncharacterized protein n=1 Tax=Sphenostylis stenocarpa TaxID=92480 RepID=A0AA86SIE9_9FABA|nr:unnamed protein product [Sphenostylis stenocarpa]
MSRRVNTNHNMQNKEFDAQACFHPMCSWLCSVTVCKRPLHSKLLHVLAAVPVRHHCIPLYQVKIPILKSSVPLSASFHVRILMRLPRFKISVTDRLSTYLGSVVSCESGKNILV